MSCEHWDFYSSIPHQGLSGLERAELGLPAAAFAFGLAQPNALEKASLCTSCPSLILCLTGVSRGHRLCLSHGIVPRKGNRGIDLGIESVPVLPSLLSHWPALVRARLVLAQCQSLHAQSFPPRREEVEQRRALSPLWLPARNSSCTVSWLRTLPATAPWVLM